MAGATSHSMREWQTIQYLINELKSNREGTVIRILCLMKHRHRVDNS